MAESINIKINTETVAATKSIAKFSKVSATNIAGIFKSIEVVNQGFETTTAVVEKQNKVFKQTNDTLKETEDNTGKVVSTFRFFLPVLKKLGEGFLNNKNFIVDFTSTTKALFKTLKESFLDIRKIALSLFESLREGDELGFGIGLVKLNRTLAKSFKDVNKDVANVNDTFRETTFVTERYAKEAGGTVLELGALSGVLAGLFKNTESVSKVFDLGTKAARFFSEGVDDFAKVTNTAFKTVLSFNNSFFGLIENVGTAGVILTGLGSILVESESELARFAGKVSLIAGIVTTGLSAAIVFAITKIGDLAFSIGTTLVNELDKSLESFTEFERKSFVFQRTFEGFSRAFGAQIGTFDQLNGFIEDLSQNTGFLTKDLRGAATEIVATTSALGFNANQQQKLLEVVTDYASFLGTDVVQTSIDFISALNGQTQSVQKFGVKLGQTALDQKAFNKGIEGGFRGLSETEKVQFRFQSLLSQYTPIAGNAAAVTETLAGQNQRLANNLDKINQSFGAGVAIIENQNVVAAASNLVLNNLNGTLIQAAGFFSALGSRVLQIGGLFLKFSFQIFAVIKAVKLLNTLLALPQAASLATRTIPFLNTSFADLAKSIGFAGGRVSSVSQLLTAFGQVAIRQSKVIIGSLLGIQTASVTVGTTVRGLLVRSLFLLKGAIFGVVGALGTLIFNPVVLGIGAVVAGASLLVKGFQEVEKRTKVFSNVFLALSDSVSGFSVVLGVVQDVVGDFGTTISTIFNKAFGVVVAAITKATSAVLSFVEINPFGAFDQRQIDKISKAKKRLDGFGTSISKVSFDLRKLPKDVSRGIAGTNDNLKKIDLQPILKLQEELSEVGLTDLEKLKKQRDQRLNIIKDGLSSTGKAREAALAVQAKIIEDFNAKRAELAKKEADSVIEEQRRVAQTVDQINKDILATRERSVNLRTGSDQQGAFANLFGADTAQRRQISDLQKRINDVSLPLEDKKRLQGQADALEKALSGDSLTGAGVSIAQSFAKGKEGAKALVTNLGKAGLSAAFGPAFGEAAGPLLEAFTKGPEATRQLVNDFSDALPDIVVALAESAPVFVEAIADNIDVIIERLVDKSDEIIISLVRAMPRVATALAIAASVEVPLALIRSFPSVVAELVKELLRSVPNALGDALASSIGKAVVGVFKTVGQLIFDGFIDAFTGGFDILGNLFKKIFKFDGGGRGAVEKFLGFDFPFIAFNRGGFVPGTAPFQGDDPKNDVVPALLSPGELVVPRSIVNRGGNSILSFLQGAGIQPPQQFFIGGLVKTFADTLNDVGNSVGSFFGDPVGFADSVIRDPGGAAFNAFNAGSQIGGSNFSNFIADITKDIPVVGEPIADAFNRIAALQEILEGLAKIGAQVDVVDLVQNPTDVIGAAVRGAKGFLGDTLKNGLRASMPLQNGGQIPAGFPNDTFPASLTSGELVVSRDLTRRLEASIEREERGASGSDVTNALLNQIVDLLSSPQEVNTQVNIEGRRLADAILQLNRQNARLA